MEERQKIKVTVLIVLGLVIILGVWFLQLRLSFQKAKLPQVIQDVSGFASEVKDSLPSSTEQITP
jgi:hypothetical protein